MELENILADKTWQKLGACEISCVNAYDSSTPNVSDVELINATNARIETDVKTGTKPKTEIELLKEQIAALTEKINNPILPIQPIGIETPFGKESRELLFAEAKELGLNPAKNVKTEILKDLVAKAKTLN